MNAERPSGLVPAPIRYDLARGRQTKHDGDYGKVGANQQTGLTSAATFDWADDVLIAAWGCQFKRIDGKIRQASTISFRWQVARIPGQPRAGLPSLQPPPRPTPAIEREHPQLRERLAEWRASDGSRSSDCLRSNGAGVGLGELQGWQATTRLCPGIRATLASGIRNGLALPGSCRQCVLEPGQPTLHKHIVRPLDVAALGRPVCWFCPDLDHSPRRASFACPTR